MDLEAELARIADRHGLSPEARSDLARLLAPELTTVGGDVTAITLLPEGASDDVTVVRPVQRYSDLGLIGMGGMGEVRRVHDRELRREVALKVIRADLSVAALAQRFVEEAQIAAQLQHPGIPPVHEIGRLADGRWYFTMKEVRGRTLTAEIHGLHADFGDVALRRLVGAFRDACNAVAYAHARGVVHRDLKPDNVLLGGFGEVLVIDWGLAKVVGRPDERDGSVETRRSGDHSLQTRMGTVVGTAAYMSPEQARGDIAALDARSDVYALGATLYEIIGGHPPYLGPEAVAAVRAGPPPRLEPGTTVPADLVAACERAMAREPSDRFASAGDLAAEMTAWLDGARRRERAMELVQAADALVDDARAARGRAASLRTEARRLIEGAKPWDPEERKAPSWARRDEAARIDREASLLAAKRESLLQGALAHAPELTEARARLAEIERTRHASAEADRDERRAAKAEVRLREHADALPASHPVRRQVATWLDGHGALTLRTDPEGAEVEVYRYELRNRRLVAIPQWVLGRTPLIEVPLARGSYLCSIRHPERAMLRYPVCVGRGEHWDGIHPRHRTAHPIRLAHRGELEAGECLVPAGWFWAGGDPEALSALPRRQLWCDERVMKRFPVTNREYVAFLDDLVASGREDDALRHQPRERAALTEGAPVYGRDGAGRFVLRSDADGHRWDPDWPVFLVDWYGASAYAAWLAERTGRPWRLPGELEWEKAARGVDGRFFPWGDHPDASWGCIRASHPGPPLPAVVDSYPVDESPYGVRGMGGNVQDWCGDAWSIDGPPSPDEVVEPIPAAGEFVAVLRGGYWTGTERHARASVRSRGEPGSRSEVFGFRVVHG